MSAISVALSEVKARIPPPILEKVFINRAQHWRATPMSLDDHILNAVIRPRVLVACNLVGGTEVHINLANVPYERVDDITSVYRIPKDKTQGRTIISVLNITYADPARSGGYGTGVASAYSSSTESAAQGMVNALANIPVTSTAYVQLISENTVMVRDTMVVPANSFLRCVLENDEEMSHIQLRSYRAFSNLVTHAVKAYIYNEYIIQLDMGELSGGVSLGMFKEIIVGYADAEANYQDYLSEVWEKTAFMNDRETFTRFLKTMIGAR